MPAFTSPQPESLGYGRPFVDQDDVDAVVAVLRGERLTQGPAVEAFEQGLERATGAGHAVAVANGTLALELAYRALDVERGSVVLTTPNTFLATASAAIHCGAEVDFVDIERRTGNLDLDRLAERLESGLPADVVAPVHFAGLPCDMQRLLAMKRAFGFRIVEDAAHALGGGYRADGRLWRVGEHPEVDATILSFHPVKHVTTAEGGAVLTHRPEIAARLRRLRDHGLDRELRFGRDGTWPLGFAPMVELGWNARLSDVHAALGASQLHKLPDFLAARREIAMRYMAELRDLEFLDPGGADREHAWHLFVVRTEERERDALALALRERGIQAQVHYWPVPGHPWFQARYGERSLPEAERHGRRALSLPIHPSLSERNQGRVIEALHHGRRPRIASCPIAS